MKLHLHFKMEVWIAPTILREREEKRKTEGGNTEKGGRELWWLLALSAVQICWERQSIAPPQTTAAGLPLQFRANIHREIFAAQEKQLMRLQGKRQEEEVEKVRSTGQVSDVFFRWTELPRGWTSSHFTLGVILIIYLLLSFDFVKFLFIQSLSCNSTP